MDKKLVNSRPALAQHKIFTLSTHLGYINSRPNKACIQNARRYFLACVAFLRGQVGSIHHDAYPFIHHLTRSEVMGIVEGICSTPGIKQSEIAHKLLREKPLVTLHDMCNSISKTTKAMCLQLEIGVNPQGQHIPKTYWEPLRNFLAHERPSANAHAYYAQEVHRYLVTRAELTANRQLLETLTQDAATPSGRLRLWELYRSPFKKDLPYPQATPVAPTGLAEVA